ncbi:NADAR family protein [Bremerella sp. T1]|uniref:NADAR family protein n=1 Tax=Bremerella sp. TYQ1 TaxID=3119568 RepID=UPI001CCE1C4E|nr:NADAR family protein [Bremerella volcania]UBM35338.1 NADAR family protein [Bremerella volcania]
MILIRKVKDEYGWLGNMSPFPVLYEGKKYRTTEALFQALRFDDEKIIESIREQKSPMAAKMIAKKHKDRMVVEPLSRDDLDNMRLVLRLKLLQHPKLRTFLLATGDQEIVEDCTKRPRGSGLFWGAANRDGEWVGENWLGRLWIKLRTELTQGCEVRMDQAAILTS